MRAVSGWRGKRPNGLPSEGPITKVMPSDGGKRDTVPLAVGRWYDFHEFGRPLGNVGLGIEILGSERLRFRLPTAVAQC